jgi:hypothetical protein
LDFQRPPAMPPAATPPKPTPPTAQNPFTPAAPTTL